MSALRLVDEAGLHLHWMRECLQPVQRYLEPLERSSCAEIAGMQKNITCSDLVYARVCV